ncbi:MAG: hypothetical protein CR972_04175 [Candidatus Moraniibacteriota bacterium]|nr:MAG: hypothetical protein CR972_04175 [Candidatus Moranbacteria bacterium]
MQSLQISEKNNMTDFDTQYNMLNAEQKKAVDTITGPVIVVAGPGTGKTQILTLRIANILKSAGGGITPENILALTFTNAGVVAMRERLATFIGAEEAYRTNIFTFHSFCEDQIKQNSDHFPEITFSRVATDIEKIHILEKILTENEYDCLTTFNSSFHYIKDILYAIDELKREGVDPDNFLHRITAQKEAILSDPDSYYKRDTKKNKKGDVKESALKPIHKNRDLQKVYALYQKELKENKLYDFTDMIMQFVSVSENNEEFASILREQYQYILVDEHQDTNDGQNRIINILTDAEHLGEQPNLFTVGDDKQAIYRFQGADIGSFLHFGKKFDDAVIINLKDNYRSAQGILDEAHTLIMSGEDSKKHVELTAFKKDSARIHVKHFRDYKEELVHIADDILAKIEGGVAPEEIAVFYREHNNLPFVREVFEKRGVPFVVTARQNVLDDVEVQKLITFLRVVHNPGNDREFSKLLLLDIVDIDVDDALAILEHFGHVSRKKSMYQFLCNEKELVRYGVVEIEKVRELIAFIKTQKKLSENTYLVEFFEKFVRESQFLEHVLSQKDHVFLLKKLSRLFDEVRDLVSEKKKYKLKDLIEHLDTYEGYNLSMDVVPGADMHGVNLMTAHGSKGLEFEHVYITNVINGLWGGKKNIKKFTLPINVFSGDIEDERRLFYVAITRAKKELTISYADHDMGGRERLPSLFISDINATPVDIEEEVGGYEIFFAPRMRMLASIISQEYIRDQFFSMQLSATALNNYFDSPILYFFRNVVRLPSTQNKTMLCGSVLHAALEGYFKKSHERKEFLSKEELIDIFEKSMELLQVPYEYFDSIKRRGYDVLGGYYDQYRDTFSLDVELEKKIKAVPFDLDSGEEILLTGVIDKIVHKGDGTISVVDYKSGKPWSRYDKNKKESLRRQVVFYKLLLDSYNSGQYNMVSGELDFIEPHPDTHEYEKEIIKVNDNDVVRIKKEINTFAQDVLSGAFLDDVIEKKWGDSSMDEYIALLNMVKKR